jgi:hypothetical protein
MIKHVVTFTWKDATDTEAVASVMQALRELPASIQELQAYEFGPDLGLNEGNGDFALVATVADEVALGVYLEHPLHVPVAKRLRELAQSRTAVQISS